MVKGPPPHVSSDEALKRLADSTNDAGKQVIALTFTFVGVATYVWVTVASIEDFDLLVGRMVRLPLLGVEIPLRPFFAIIPVIITVLHGYLLLQLAHLNRRVRYLVKFKHAVSEREDDVGQISYPLDRSVFFYPFLGFDLLFGQRSGEEAKGSRFLNWMVLTAFIGTYAILPAVTLGLVQNCFLAYQSFTYTLWHGCLIVVDLVFSAALIPSRAESKRVLPGPPFGKRLRWGGTILGIILELMILAYKPPCDGTSWFWVEKVFSRTLKVPNVEIVRDPSSAISLAGRQLRCADLSGTSLRGVDLQGANLQDAILRNADLEGANLLPSSLSEKEWTDRVKPVSTREVNDWLTRERRGERTNLEQADLWRANFGGARLAFARLEGIQAEGVDFTFADLTGVTAERAVLRRARLIGSRLDYASLRDVDFDEASMMGASLRRVRGAGASFPNAKLNFADLTEASLYFATFVEAELNGARMTDSFVAGSDFRAAHLKGVEDLPLNLAWFTSADLRGVNLDSRRPPRLSDLRRVKIGSHWSFQGILLEIHNTRRELAKSEASEDWAEKVLSRFERAIGPPSPGETLHLDAKEKAWRLLVDPSRDAALLSLQQFHQEFARELVAEVLHQNEPFLFDLLCRRARGNVLVRDPPFEEVLLGLLRDSSLPAALQGCWVGTIDDERGS